MQWNLNYPLLNFSSEMNTLRQSPHRGEELFTINVSFTQRRVFAAILGYCRQEHSLYLYKRHVLPLTACRGNCTLLAYYYIYCYAKQLKLSKLYLQRTSKLHCRADSLVIKWPADRQTPFHLHLFLAKCLFPFLFARSPFQVLCF